MLPHIVTPVPGPRSCLLAKELQRYESRNVTYTSESFPIFWGRAEGVNVWDVDQNRFLDLTAGFAVTAHGHTNPAIRSALNEQSAKLLHAMGDVHPAETKVKLCRRLSEVTFERWGFGPAKTTLSNSGFEAVEIAIKTSLLHSGNPGLIAFGGSYHGLGYGALNATGIPWFRDPFRSQLRDLTTWIPYPYCFRCPFGRNEGHRLEGARFPNCATFCLQKIEEQIVATIQQRPIGCILVEPCLGRGGDVVPPLDFLRLLRQISDAHKVLLIFDEIYTGFNRTGFLFAADAFGVYPDLLCLGKGLTTGFPLSACVGRSDIMDAWPRSAGEALHTSTFLGNPLGCAMALASIDLHLKQSLPPRIKALGQQFKQSLQALSSPALGNVRGIGLMFGVELVNLSGSPNRELARRVIHLALRDGLLLLGGGPAGNVLSLTPPFCIEPAEIDFACEHLQGYLRLGSVS
jgi:4-aminobutyrate aminotransferase-like enzyme